MRPGFDLRRLATGRQAANDPRGLFNFTGDISGYSMADFMLGLPRTVIPPTDQIQGHVGGWRNGFFVNDNWQPTRNLTLSLGLRYERDTPVQTYAGVADMLAEDFLTIIPSPNRADYPVKGFKFTEPNNKDWAPRLGATYRLSEKTVLRAGYGIYYNPNQMNSFTFLTNNPPLAVVSTFTSDPANPTLSFEHPTGVAGPAAAPDMISPTRHLPDARKDQWSVDLQREVWASGGIDIEYVGSNTSHLDRSFFNNTPTPGPGAVDPRRPTSLFRSRRIIQNDLIADYDAVTFGLRQADAQGPAGGRALHLVADARHVDALERRRPDDGQLRHLARLRTGELGHPAPPRGELPVRHSVPEVVAAAGAEIPRRRLAGLRRDDDSERLARQRHAQHRSRQHRDHGTAAARSRRRRAGAELRQPIRIRRGVTS